MGESAQAEPQPKEEDMDVFDSALKDETGSDIDDIMNELDQLQDETSESKSSDSEESVESSKVAEISDSIESEEEPSNKLNAVADLFEDDESETKSEESQEAEVIAQEAVENVDETDSSVEEDKPDKIKAEEEPQQIEATIKETAEELSAITDLFEDDDASFEEESKSEVDEAIVEASSAEGEEVNADDVADALAEFRDGAGEGSLEDTMGEMKQDEISDSSKDSILDDPDVFEAASDAISDDIKTMESESESESEPEESTDDESEATFFEFPDPSDSDDNEPEGNNMSRKIPKIPKSSGGSDDSSAQEGALSLVLRGKMTLDLTYECEGTQVSVGFENNNFVVRLSDGTEFKVPVNKSRKAIDQAA